MTPFRQRAAWLAATFALIAGLIMLDTSRGGPATALSRCNLALTRASAPPADVLVIGSSRTGTAVDPVAMERMLAAEPTVGEPTVERIALGRSPLKTTVALLENYLEQRGDPAVLVFEVSFITPRTVIRASLLDPALTPDAVLFRRDVNLLTYDQLLTTPAVAQPFTQDESTVNRLRYALRGAVLRTGALAYQFAQEPTTTFSIEDCDVSDVTREPTWPPDLSFSWGENTRVATPAEQIESLRVEAASAAETRQLQPWQLGRATGEPYPYDVAEPYRTGEMKLLDRAVSLAAERDVPIVLMLLPTYGTSVAAEDIAALEIRYTDAAVVYDLYAEAGVDLSTFWYDDAHLQIAVAGELTTALLAQRLVDGPLGGSGPPSNSAAGS